MLPTQPLDLRVRDTLRTALGNSRFISCSQKRTTFHPISRSVSFTLASRAQLPEIFFSQKAEFIFGAEL